MERRRKSRRRPGKARGMTRKSTPARTWAILPRTFRWSEGQGARAVEEENVAKAQNEVDIAMEAVQLDSLLEYISSRLNSSWPVFCFQQTPGDNSNILRH